MDLKKCYIGILVLTAFVVSCSALKAPQWSGSGFLKREFFGYKRVAVLPFEGDSKGEISEDFSRAFQEKFPELELIKTKRLLEVFRKEDLSPNRMSPVTRKKIQELFGVEVLVMGKIIYPSIVRWLLQVQIVDAETDEVLGRSLAEVNFIGAEGSKEACEIAVKYLNPE